MKLMFHKTELYGQWFDNDVIDNEFTEKVPPFSNYYFDDTENDWLESPNTEIPDTDND